MRSSRNCGVRRRIWQRSAKGARQIVDQAGPEVVASLQRVHVVADNLAKATDQIQKLIGDNRQDLRSFTRDGLPELERLLREGRAAAQELRELSASLRENPSQLLYQPKQVGWRYRSDAPALRQCMMPRRMYAAALAGCCAVVCTAMPRRRRCMCCAPRHIRRPPRKPATASLHVNRPMAAPGLDSDHIVLVQPDHKMSYYVASRWPADLPSVVESLAVDTLRTTR